MKLDLKALTQAMTDAVRAAVGGRWSAIRGVAEPELKKLAETLAEVHRLHRDGDIDADRAKQLVSMQVNAAHGVLKTVKGLGLLTAQEAVGAATRAAGEIVNRLIGFRLISSPAEPAQRPKARFKAGKDI